MEFVKPVNVYLRGQQYESIRRISKEHDISYSSIVREGLDMALAKYENRDKTDESKK